MLRAKAALDLLLLLALALAVHASDDDAAALLTLKAGFIDPAGRLATWAANGTQWAGKPCGDADACRACVRPAVDAAGASGAALPCCPWAGVGCTGGRVTELDLACGQGCSLPLGGQLWPGGGAPPARLRTFDVDRNDLTGPLPSGLASARELEILRAAFNRLSGPLPPAWGGLAGLGTLDVRRNGALDGLLPPSWGGLANLTQLLLDGNNLSGPLPPAWAGMHALEVALLGDNAFRGPVPDSWSDLGQLRMLSLAGLCGVCGRVPDALLGRVELDLRGSSAGQACGASNCTPLSVGVLLQASVVLAALSFAAALCVVRCVVRRMAGAPGAEARPVLARLQSALYGRRPPSEPPAVYTGRRSVTLVDPVADGGQGPSSKPKGPPTLVVGPDGECVWYGLRLPSFVSDVDGGGVSEGGGGEGRGGGCASSEDGRAGGGEGAGEDAAPPPSSSPAASRPPSPAGGDVELGVVGRGGGAAGGAAAGCPP